MTGKTGKKGDTGCAVKDCCGRTKIEKHTPLAVLGAVETKSGDIPVVAAKLAFRDILGSFRMRWGIGRYGYSIEPGIYALGRPDPSAPVFVTANYKMSFDRLRKELHGLDCFILVLDTKGINVWCAAGKGTFGTEELLERIKAVGLKKIVRHSQVILPQLGAPGVAAHIVSKKTGFKIIYGPVRAKDIPLFIRNGFKAGEKMRRVDFPFKDRIVLTPMELVAAYKIILGVLIFLCLVELITAGPVSSKIFTELLPYLGAIAVGAVLAPALLPWLPGRSFAFKGWTAGIIYAVIIGYLFSPGPGTFTAWLFILPAMVSFITLNFTGCSTYTSLSGVLREMRYALPALIFSALAGIIIKFVFNGY